MSSLRQDLSAKLLIAPCSIEAARHAVEQWHYSKVLPTGKMLRLGVWERGDFRGVVIFSRGASPNLGKKWGLGSAEVSELTRIALREHDAPVSRLISISTRDLARRNPGLRLSVSFADPNEGHLGVVYQAAGWIYTGQSSPVTGWRIGGRWRHRRGSWHQAKGKRVRTRVFPGKFRYVRVLQRSDRELRRIVEAKRLPYPKSCEAIEPCPVPPVSPVRSRGRSSNLVHGSGYDCQKKTPAIESSHEMIRYVDGDPKTATKAVGDSVFGSGEEAS